MQPNEENTKTKKKKRKKKVAGEEEKEMEDEEEAVPPAPSVDHIALAAQVVELTKKLEQAEQQQVEQRQTAAAPFSPPGE